MKRLLSLIVGVMLFFTSYSQTLVERSDGTFTQGDTFLAALKALSIPYGATPTFSGGLQRAGSLFFNTTDTLLMVWDGADWLPVGKETDLSNYYKKAQVDSLLLLKENIANKVFDFSAPNNTTYPSTKAVKDALDALTFPSNLSLGTPTGTTVPILNSNGTGVILGSATTSDAGLMSSADKSKLNGIEAQATKNQTDAYLLNRTNHTGEQAISTVTGLQTSLDSKVPVTRTINGKALSSDVTLTGADITGVVTTTGNQTVAGNKTLSGTTTLSGLSGTGNALAGLTSSGQVTRTALSEAPANSSVPIRSSTGTLKASDAVAANDVTTLGQVTSSLSGKQNTLVSGTNIKTVGGQTLLGSGDVPFPEGVEAATASTIPKRTSTATIKAANATANDELVPLGQLNTRLGDYIPLTQKGAINGVATLDGSGQIPIAQIPVSNPYKGVWDASTNTPTIADGVGTVADRYRVAVAGTQNLGSGNITFSIGDDVIYNGSVWERAPGGATSTNLGLGTINSTTLEITNSNGNGVVLPSATISAAGLLSATDKTAINSAVQPGDNITTLTNDANFIIQGTGSNQVRSNTDLDARYLQSANALVLGETSTSAYRGDRGKAAYDYSQVGHLPLAGGTVTGQIKRNADASTGDDLPRLSQVQGLISAIPAYTLPQATSTVMGGVKISDNTVQSVAPNASTATAGRSYGVQLDANGRAVVNVPWTDNNTTYTGSTSVVLDGNSFKRAALTGDVTSAENSNATVIAGKAITYAKLQDLSGNSVIGRSASTTGVSGAIQATTNGSVLRLSGTTLGFGTIGDASISDIAFSKLTSLPTTLAGYNIADAYTKTEVNTLLNGKQATLTAGANIDITDNVISATNTTYTAGANVNISGNVISATNTTYSAGAGLTLTGSTFSLPVSTSGSGSYVQSVTQGANGLNVTLGTPPNTTYTGSASINLSGSSFQRAALTGDVTADANSNTTVIGNNTVNDAKLADVPTGTLKGRVASGTGDPTNLTSTQVMDMLNAESLANKATSFTTLNNTLYPTTQAVANYVTSQIPAPQTLSQPAIGQIAISGGNTINLNTVNTSGNQTGIAGNKEWVGVNRFIPNIRLSGSTSGDRGIFFETEGSLRWLVYTTSSPESGTRLGSNFRIASYNNTGGEGRVDLNIDRSTGSMTIGSLAGTGNGIVGVTSTGTLTRTNVADFGYVPYTGATSAVNLNAQNLTNVGTFRAGVTQIPTNTVEVATKNRSYYLITNTDGTPVAKWETQYWNGTAFVGANSYGFGHQALQSNSGNNSNGFGYQALVSNTGAGSNGFGYSALQNNTGLYSNGFGHQALRYNKGAGNNAFGYGVLSDDPGATVRTNITAIGYNIPWSAITKNNQTVFSGHEIIGLDLTNARINSAAGNALVTKDWVGSQLGNGTLTLATSTGLSGSASFTANQTGNATFTVGIDSGYKLPTTTEWDAKEDAANKVTSLSSPNNTTFPTTQAVADAIASSIDSMSYAEITAGTSVIPRSIKAKTLHDWLASKSYISTGASNSLLANTAGYLVGGTDSNQVRNNYQLDLRYLQTEVDPTVPSYVKSISESDILSWNNKVGSIGVANGVKNTGTASAPVLEIDSVKLNQLEVIPAGTLIGMDGGGVNSWVEITPTISTPNGFSGDWGPLTSYSPGVGASYQNNLYVSIGFPPVGEAPNVSGSWELKATNFSGGWSEAQSYNTGQGVAYYGSGWKYYRTTAPTSGVAPDETPSTAPGKPKYLTVGTGLRVKNNVLYSTGASSISGLIRAGANVSITGLGTASSPYVIASTSGGSGSSTLAGLLDVSVGGATNGQSLVYQSGTWVAQTISGGGGFRLRSGSNPFLSGDVTLLPGSGVSFSQSGNNITISSTGGGGGGGIAQLTGDVTTPGGGSGSATIVTGAVTNTKMANMSANTVKGRVGSSGVPQDLNSGQLRQIINSTGTNNTTTIDMSGPRLLKLAAISSNTTYALSNLVDGAEVQATVTNTGSNTVDITITGAVGLGSTSIAAGKVAVISIQDFGGGTVRYVVVTEL